MKKAAALLFLMLGIAIGASLILLPSNARPNDDALIKRFHEKRLAYERLRDLLLAEKSVALVASWGVETADSPGSLAPPIADFSLARYGEYLALLKDAGGLVISRSRAMPPEVCIYVWAAGLAGDRQHEALCWSDQEPLDQVASLDKIDDLSADAAAGLRSFYKHVESKWYLERDE